MVPFSIIFVGEFCVTIYTGVLSGKEMDIAKNRPCEFWHKE